GRRCRQHRGGAGGGRGADGYLIGAGCLEGVVLCSFYWRRAVAPGGAGLPWPSGRPPRPAPVRQPRRYAASVSLPRPRGAPPPPAPRPDSHLTNLDTPPARYGLVGFVGRGEEKKNILQGRVFQPPCAAGTRFRPVAGEGLVSKDGVVIRMLHDERWKLPDAR